MFFPLLPLTGERGLEIRGPRPRPSLPVDLHIGRPGRNGRHHSPGALPLRRSGADRQQVRRNRQLQLAIQMSASEIVAAPKCCR